MQLPILSTTVVGDDGPDSERPFGFDRLLKYGFGSTRSSGGACCSGYSDSGSCFFIVAIFF